MTQDVRGKISMKTHKRDLNQSILKWKKANPKLALTFDQDYASFKIGVLLKQAREEAAFPGKSSPI